MNKSKEAISDKIQMKQNYEKGRKSHNLELEEFRQIKSLDEGLGGNGPVRLAYHQE
jgi:hypothetical protein